MKNRCKTIFLGTIICFVVNIPLFMIIYHRTVMFWRGLSQPHYYEDIYLAKIIICSMGGFFLYGLKYGKSSKDKIPLRLSLRSFLKNYGITFAVIFFAWVIYASEYSGYFGYMLRVRGYDNPLSIPVWKLFIEDSLLSYSLLAYIMLALTYCFQKNKGCAIV